METSLSIMTNASKMLAEATTIQKTKELKDLALTSADWAKRKGMGDEAVRYCMSYALEAERKMGELLKETERAIGTDKGGRKGLDGSRALPSNAPPTLAELGISKKESSNAQFLAGLPEEAFDKIKTGEMTINNAISESKRKNIIANLEDISNKKAKAIQGVYDVVVIDPPWPMEKIERDCRPNQSEFDYPTMTENELSDLSIPCAENAHVFLWTTNKFLPMALRILDAWKLKYILCMTWHKPGGFQPFGLPQFNSEFIIYSRFGSPQFVDTKNFFTCFSAPRGDHSVKPEEFYDTVRRVTAGRRIDMFGRRHIEGFDSWGKEAL
jgi:N6-adenosine-specific RNA methylase IME4